MLICTIPLLDEFQDDIFPSLSSFKRVESFFVYFFYIFYSQSSFFPDEEICFRHLFLSKIHTEAPLIFGDSELNISIFCKL